MTNGIAIHNLQALWERSRAKSDRVALEMGIKALEQTSHLVDRPCSACEYHKENGCSQWSCVFEEVNADAQ